MADSTRHDKAGSPVKGAPGPVAGRTPARGLRELAATRLRGAQAQRAGLRRP